MPLESPDKEFFEDACGYAQLGMYLDENEEVETIDPFLCAAPEILAFRIEIYRAFNEVVFSVCPLETSASLCAPA